MLLSYVRLTSGCFLRLFGMFRRAIARTGTMAYGHGLPQGSRAGFRLTGRGFSRIWLFRTELLQHRVLHFCSFQDGNIGLGVFQEGEEIPVRALRLRTVTGHREGSRYLEMGQ